MRSHLKRGLAGLPTPKNDFEIVVPEDMNENVEDIDPHQYIEDQADLDDRAEADRQARGRFLVSLAIRLQANKWSLYYQR